MKLLMNERGDTFILALVLLTTAGVLFVGAQSVVESSLNRLNTYKVRARMNILEQRTRMALNQPMAFANCNSKEGVASCSLNLPFLKTYTSNTGIGAEFEVDGWNLDPVRRLVTARLVYTGPYKIKNTDIAIKIPDELLQSLVFSCPALDNERPVFQGLDPTTGKIICGSLPACPRGTYLRGIEAATANSVCHEIPKTPIGCPAGSMLSEWSWVGNEVKYACKPRLNPFDYFGGP